MIEGKGALDTDANVVVDGTTYEAGRGGPRDRLGRAARSPGVEFGDRIVDTWGAWSLPALPKSIARRRRRRLGRRDRLRLHPLRHRGDPDRDAPADPPGRGQGRRPGGRAGLQEAGDQDPHRQPDRGRRGRHELRQGQGRRRGDRGRVPGDRRRPRARHRGARARRRRASSSATAAGSRSTSTSGPRTRRSTRSATSSAARRSPTRPRRRGSSRPRRSPARRPIRSTRTSSPARPSAIRRSPASG